MTNASIQKGQPPLGLTKLLRLFSFFFNTLGIRMSRIQEIIIVGDALWVVR